MIIQRNRLSLILFISAFMATAALADTVENYDSGKAKLVNIMSNEDTGIAAYNKKNIKYAETQNLANDLNIAQIAESLGCHTVMGKSFIEETLKHPVSVQDKDSVLMPRQNAIKALVENPDFKKEVEQFLKIAKEAEQEVIKLLSDFFKGKTCPELATLELMKKQNPYLYPIFEFMTMNPTAKSVNTALNLVGIPASAYGIVKPGQLIDAHAKIFKIEKIPSAVYALAGAYMGIITGVSIYQAYKDYSTGSEKRAKMHALNQLITIAEKIEKLSADHGLKNQFNISEIKDADGRALIDGLKHARYQEKDTKLFLTPSVHTFLYSLYQQDKYLAKVFACIAELDAYNALASKIIASQNENNKFCFVNFIENEKPVINATGFWNILVQNPVVNTISENKNVLLTGPNKGGKTTSIRALLQNVVLGQSFGVAAAEKFEYTMFDTIHSYLNISDDLINGLSLFASELKRAQEILEKIKSLETDKKFFFALDELFTGTVAEDGEVCAYEFVKKISTFDNILFIYATHFGKMKELGTDNPLCMNYKVDAPTKNDAGKLVYPFTLSQGASDAHVALDLAREAGLFE